VEIRIELDATDPPRGRTIAADQRAFNGWLGLLRTLEDLFSEGIGGGTGLGEISEAENHPVER
jgi:hypothetical protein